MSNRTLTALLSPFALLAAHAAFAQAPAQPDFSAVQIKVHQVAGNFYYLEGQGGNVGVLVGDDGVLMIDDQFAPLTEKLVAAVRTISKKPIKMLVNTHVHGDHVGGNENIGKMGVEIIAHDNVRARMIKGVSGAPPAPTIALPVVTYGDAIALHFNGEDLEVGKLPPAHTDGDSYIRLTKADVIHVGDVFRTVGYPLVDGGNGGTVKGTLAALDRILDIAGPSTKILPGHGTVATRDDVAAFRNMVADLQTKIGTMIKQGMTLEQVIAAKPTADLDAKLGAPERFLTLFYNALKSEL
ncbi:MAG TPA: MBL fold metallo-hydrolase [Gammaproteobacteria bacterium]|jgi:glyoxylase-like metal-dependent hydrolase (beta-lactamase superfamily II)|nr:MBL fold metallo-hydrolase [Gammaproteobacteria bacterium]